MTSWFNNIKIDQKIVKLVNRLLDPQCIIQLSCYINMIIITNVNYNYNMYKVRFENFIPLDHCCDISFGLMNKVKAWQGKKQLRRRIGNQTHTPTNVRKCKRVRPNICKWIFILGVLILQCFKIVQQDMENQTLSKLQSPLYIVGKVFKSKDPNWGCTLHLNIKTLFTTK